jgi:hypothetical protein
VSSSEEWVECRPHRRQPPWSANPGAIPHCADRSHQHHAHPVAAEVWYVNAGGWQESSPLCRPHADQWRAWAEEYAAQHGIAVTITIEPV